MPKSVPKSVTSLIDPSHPVINALGNTFGGYLPGRRSALRGIKGGAQNVNKSGVNPRVDVVDERLCDDILKYLAPTLQQYKGCTIIDAHPGACVWSAKLHEFLKPKRHILMEPEERYVKSFIQPLLDKPASTFQLLPRAALGEKGALEAFRTALADESLPPSPPKLPDDDPRLRHLDTSVLVTGNLARTFPWLKTHSVVQKASPQAHVALQQLTTWSWLSPQTFRSQGLVRMLWWIPDQHKALLVPHLMYQNSALNTGMQMGAQLTEVVGVEPAKTYAMSNHNRTKAVTIRDRAPVYDAEISNLVHHKMNEAGMTIPKGRSVLGGSSKSSKGDPVMRSPVELRYHTVHELESTVKGVQTRCKGLVPAIKESGQVNLPKKVEKILGSWHDTIEYPQSILISREHTRHYPTRDPPKKKWEQSSTGLTAVQSRIALLLDMVLRLISLEAHYAALDERGEDVALLKDDILQVDADIQALPIFNRTSLQYFISRAISEQLAFFSQPPLLPRDRRSYEPLQAPLDSFWPKYPLALLDIVPTGRDLTIPGIADRYEATRTTSELIKYLFAFKNHSVPSVLDKIAPNAAQDLIPQVPALTDPRKGGRLNPGNLSVRMLSEEMIEGLVKAWFEWPFKPRLIDLALAVDGSAEEGGEQDGSGELEEGTAEA